MADLIKIKHKGDFKKTTKFLNKLSKEEYLKLSKYGQMGVDALSSATPVDSGLTASSWGYGIDEAKHTIYWYNTNVNEGVNIAIILQYGHGTGWGGYVEGRDYINPAIQPIMDKIAEEVWKEVTSS